MPTTRAQAQRAMASRSSRDDPDSDDEDSDEEYEDDSSGPSSGHENGWTRVEKVRDIFSSFDETLLWDEYRTNIEVMPPSGRSLSPATCCIQKDLEATLLRLAVNQDPVYRALRRAQPPEQCANICYEKLSNRAGSDLERLDDYAEEATVYPDGLVPNVLWLSIQLRTHVDQIAQNLAVRRSHGLAKAVNILVGMLGNICARDYDAFAEATWYIPMSPNESPRDRSLYQLLIANPQHTGYFIVDVLAEISQAEIQALQDRDRRRFVQRMEDILTTIQEQGAPVVFRQRLQRVRDNWSRITSRRGR